MEGLTPALLSAIEKLVKSKFDTITLSVLGIIPSVKEERNIVFSTTNNNLISLFLNALQSQKPDKQEENALKVILSVANGYLNSLKENVSSKIIFKVDSALKENKTLSANEINKIVDKEMDRASALLKTIVNAESNKAVNVGTAMQISKVAKSQNVDDPTVFFIVIDDERTGFYEYILHLLPDRVTPRVWKLSEVIADYYTPGGQYPSLSGLHPNCRCKLTYLALGYGFKNGRVSYVGPDYDEWQAQRAKYGLPDVPGSPKKRNGKWVLPETP